MTAFDKTLIGAWTIATRSVNTLIQGHCVQLSIFLNIAEKEIGVIGAGKVDIAMVQSIHAKRVVKDFIANYG